MCAVVRGVQRPVPRWRQHIGRPYRESPLPQVEGMLIARSFIGSLVLALVCSCTSGPRHVKPTATGSGVGSVSSPAVASTPAEPSPSGGTRPCSRQDLRSRYFGGGAGSQTFFGVLVVRNAGRQPCLVTGDVRFAAYLRDGSKDVKARI